MEGEVLQRQLLHHWLCDRGVHQARPQLADQTLVETLLRVHALLLIPGLLVVHRLGELLLLLPDRLVRRGGNPTRVLNNSLAGRTGRRRLL